MTKLGYPDVFPMYRCPKCWSQACASERQSMRVGDRLKCPACQAEIEVAERKSGFIIMSYESETGNVFLDK